MAAWTLAGALTTLRHEVDAAFPTRSKVSDGTLGDTAHAGRKSDHNPDARGVVRAEDFTRDVVDGVDVAEYLAEWLRAKKDPRVKYVIFNHRMFSSYRHEPSGTPAWQWRPYDGINAHEHHVHVSVQPYPAGDVDRAWGFTAPRPTTPEDDMPTADEVAKAVWQYGVQRRETEDPRDRIPAEDALGYAARWGYAGLTNDKAEAERDAGLIGRVVGLEQGQNSLLELVQALHAKVDALAPPVVP